MMGDNRDNSLDSRFPKTGVGFLPAEDIIGKAEVAVFSWRPHTARPKSWTLLGLPPDRSSI